MSNLISDVTLWPPDDYEAFLLKHVERLHPHNGLLISIKSRYDELIISHILLAFLVVICDLT